MLQRLTDAHDPVIPSSIKLYIILLSLLLIMRGGLVLGLPQIKYFFI